MKVTEQTLNFSVERRITAILGVALIIFFVPSSSAHAATAGETACKVLALGLADCTPSPPDDRPIVQQLPPQWKCSLPVVTGRPTFVRQPVSTKYPFGGACPPHAGRNESHMSYS